MIYAGFLILGILIFLLIHFRLYLYLTPQNRLPILMYHQIKEISDDALTVTRENLEKQLQFLNENGYQTLFFKELINKNLPKKPIILTFDDGYLNNKEYLEPLLQKFGMKATIFIPTKFVEEGYANNRIMTYKELSELDSEHIEIGLHSHTHRNFREISAKEAEEDVIQNRNLLSEQNIKVANVLAYPYGKYPKDTSKKAELFSMLNAIGIKYALRIGNKINHFPISKPFELCRIDVRGDDDLRRFKLKLIFGKLKLF